MEAAHYRRITICYAARLRPVSIQ
ncbi:hypothetical protein SMG44B_40452 [Stenotrophomonas maltophilia]